MFYDILPEAHWYPKNPDGFEDWALEGVANPERPFRLFVIPPGASALEPAREAAHRLCSHVLYLKDGDRCNSYLPYKPYEWWVMVVGYNVVGTIPVTIGAISFIEASDMGLPGLGDLFEVWGVDPVTACLSTPLIGMPGSFLPDLRYDTAAVEVATIAIHENHRGSVLAFLLYAAAAQVIRHLRKKFLTCNLDVRPRQAFRSIQAGMGSPFHRFGPNPQGGLILPKPYRAQLLSDSPEVWSNETEPVVSELEEWFYRLLRERLDLLARIFGPDVLYRYGMPAKYLDWTMPSHLQQAPEKMRY